MSKPVFLITGSMGCIGAWVIRHLLDDDAHIIATDLSATITRPALLSSDAELKNIKWNALDVTDSSAVTKMVKEKAVTHIIHLAGLQIPFCKSNPSLGAAVNVTGTVNILQAARESGVSGICYASSLAALGDDVQYPVKPVTDDVHLLPKTLYGVYKAANEGTAKVFWHDWQVGSIGLRPYCVYGVARDQGMTADLAKAILAIAANKPFHIRFSGQVALQHASDVARIFIDSAYANYQGAATCNLRGDVIDVEDFVATLKQLYPQAQITCEKNKSLPFPSDLDDSGLRSILGNLPHTPLEEAIRADIYRFSKLITQGKIDLSQLDR
jgi:nucleoside-diphosphate-sugar epimerase